MMGILNLIKEYFFVGILALLMLYIIFIIAYYIVYKKLMHGKRTLNKKIAIITIIFCVYILLVILATMLRAQGWRGGSYNLKLFSSYRKALFDFAPMAWRDIALNIIMFLPLGFLLPILNKKFYKPYFTLPISFGFTCIIELVQLVLNLGAFDLDDIFNNFLGALIGYSIVMFIITLLSKDKHKIRNVFLYLSPIMAISIIFASLYVSYELKEFGNVALCSYTEDLKNTKITLNCDLSNKSIKMPVYKAETYTAESTKEFFTDKLNKLGFETKNISIKDYHSEVYFSGSVAGKMNLLNGTYSLWNHFDDDSDNSYFYDINEVINYLNKIDVIIPNEVSFKSDKMGKYTWYIDNLIKGDTITDGIIEFEYDIESNRIDIDNDLATYNKVRDVELISENKAYNEILNGKFNIYPQNVKLDTIEITDVEIAYKLDTKGFYQPIYVFNCVVNGDNRFIEISAIK